MPASWSERAACRGLEASLFYPAAPSSPEGQAQMERARAVCASCLVREACLADVLADEKRLRPSDREGIRGGLDGRERYVMQHGPIKPRRRTRRMSKAATGPRKLAPCGTPAAYQRHLRRGEQVDEACAAGNAARVRSKRVPAVEERPECGTRSGYLWHTAHHEIPCEPCTRADLAVTWLIRQTAAA